MKVQYKQFNSHKKPALGFTLIELLLVIVILGVIASFGLSFFQNQTSRFKVEKAVQQIELLQQAALAFYTDNTAWPQNCNDPNFAIYIPVGTTTDPWGNAYTCQASSSGKKFDISTGTLPSAAIMNQILNILPSAVQNGSANQVLSEIAIPFQAPANQNGLWIQEIQQGSQITAANATLTLSPFLCPKNWSANAVAFPIVISPNPYQFPVYPNPFQSICVGLGPGSILISLLDSSVASCTSSSTSNGSTINNCAIQIAAQGTPIQQPSFLCEPVLSALGKVYFELIGYCQPPSMASQSSVTPPSKTTIPTEF